MKERQEVREAKAGQKKRRKGRNKSKKCCIDLDERKERKENVGEGIER